MKRFEALRPDYSLANRIKAMFIDDPEISLDFIEPTDGTYAKIILNVNNAKKASALRKLLPERYTDIGTPLDVEIKDVTVMDSNTIVDAFSKNPHYKGYMEFEDPMNPGLVYHVCIFKKEVIQFLNSNAGSLNGYEFRLMQDLAQEIMDVPKMIYTTDDGTLD